MIRRHWMQIGGLLLASVVVAALAVAVVRGSSPSADHRGGASPTPAASASPTPDNRVEEVKDVVRAFAQALEKSEATADASVVAQLTVPESQAAGNAGIPAAFTRSSHQAFDSLRLDIDDASWRVTVGGEEADVIVAYRRFGHEEKWPSMTPLESDHLTDPITLRLRLTHTGDAWKVFEMD